MWLQISKYCNIINNSISRHRRLFHTIYIIQIEVVADLPVGDNLQDHVMVYPFDYEVDKPVAVTGQRADSFAEIAKYRLFGDGKILSNTI